MGQIVKCDHCDFMDYRSGEPTRCPSCGSKTQKIDLPFKGESITLKIMDMRNNMVDATISFEKAESVIGSIIGKSLDKSITDEYIKHRVIFMVVAYAWVLIKKHPQLWQDIHVLVGGIVEILTLKIEGPKNAI